MLKKYIITLLLIVGYNNVVLGAFPSWFTKIFEKSMKELSLKSSLEIATNSLQLVFMVSPWVKKYFADQVAQMNMQSGKMQAHNNMLQYMIALNSLYPTQSLFSTHFSPIEKCTWYQLGQLQLKSKNIFHY